MLPLVSVIIPCYNHEQFVGQAIQSVIDQDYPNMELIIIDDGSKDNSVQKIKEMHQACEEKFTRFEIRYRPNKGLCKTLNEGIEWAEGRYLCTMASDDIWMTRKVSSQVEYLEKHIDCFGVFGGIKFIDSNNEILDELLIKDRKFSFNDIFLHKHLLPAPTGMCRLERIIEVGGYDENLAIEDWSMWLKLTKDGGTLDLLNQYFALYRRHDNNLSSNIDIMHNGRISIVGLYKQHPKYKHALFNAYLQSSMESSKDAWLFLSQAIAISPLYIFSRKFAATIRMALSRK